MKFKFFGHLKNVLMHRHLVFIYSLKVGIPLQGLIHDLSKFLPSEFIPSIKYFPKTYTPCFEERKHNNMSSLIAIRHTNRNKHHYEYWIDIYKGNIILRKIPFKYNLEFCIDGIAASKTYNKNNYSKDIPLSYFNARKERYLMHPLNKEFTTLFYLKYKESGFKSLRKKELKKIYKSLEEKYAETYIFFTSYNSNEEEIKNVSSYL